MQFTQHVAPAPEIEIPPDIRAMMEHIDALDSLIRQSTRLRLLAFLARQTEAVSFQTLLERMGLHTSNLSIHLTRLERAGMLVTEKRAKGRYPETTVAMTPAGRAAFSQHMGHLRAMLDLMETEEEQ